MKKKICPVCGDEYEGRSDKKYCTDYCRSDFNNQKKAHFKKTIRATNKILATNRVILDNFYVNGQVKCPRKKIAGSGFNFTYYTNQYTTNSGNVYYYCYDYGYRFLSNNEILIVKKEGYV